MCDKKTRAFAHESIRKGEGVISILVCVTSFMDYPWVPQHYLKNWAKHIFKSKNTKINSS